MADGGFFLTALDARRYDFGSALRGYDRLRVEQFREAVAEELERLTRVAQEADAEVRQLREQLRQFQERDRAINEALVSAQQLRAEIREQAEREAHLLVREAAAEGERQLVLVRDEIRRAEEDLQGLWRQRRTYVAQLRHQLERQLAELSSIEREPMPASMTAPPSMLPQLEPDAAARAVTEMPARPDRPTPSWLDLIEEDPQ